MRIGASAPGSSHSVPWFPATRRSGTPVIRRASSGARPVTTATTAKPSGQRLQGARGTVHEPRSTRVGHDRRQGAVEVGEKPGG